MIKIERERKGIERRKQNTKEEGERRKEREKK